MRRRRVYHITRVFSALHKDIQNVAVLSQQSSKIFTDRSTFIYENLQSQIKRYMKHPSELSARRRGVRPLTEALKH